jgi:hypothetical protein
LVAIRELLQNSFDAVREEIALQRLEKQDPINSEWKEMLESMHLVDLTLDMEDDRIWLICTDDGSGMSKNVIENNLLISGNSRRREIRLLERRCREHGFEMERTGQFGIGVLSYFMIADLVQIHTKRSSLAEDAESSGWYFETDGISSFGELRRNQMWRQGTQVRLRIRSNFIRELEKLVVEFAKELDKEVPEKNFGEYQEILDEMGDPRQFSWWNKEAREISLLKQLLVTYLQISLRQLPCKLKVRSILGENTEFNFQKGWAQNPSELVNLRVNSLVDRWQAKRLFRKEGTLESTETKEETTTLRAVIEALPNKIKNCMSWKTIGGDLANNLGKYRVHIPIFQLGENISNYYFDIIDDTKDALDVNVLGLSRGLDDYQFIFKPRGHLYMSWKGMAVSSSEEKYLDKDLYYYYPRKEEDALIEIDWENDEAGVLSVSREEISLSEAALAAIDDVRVQVLEIYDNFVNEIEDSPFSILTHVFVAKKESRERLYWLYQSDSNRRFIATWGPVKFPVVDLAVGMYFSRNNALKHRRLKWLDKNVQILNILNINFTGAERYRGPSQASWSSTLTADAFNKSRRKDEIGYPPDRLMLLQSEEGSRTVGIWLEPPKYRAGHVTGFVTTFPPQWSKLAGIKLVYASDRVITDVTAWNVNHPLSKSLNQQTINWARETFKDDLDPRVVKDELLVEKDKAIAWLALIMSSYSDDMWNALVEQENEFLKKIWELVFNEDSAHENIYMYDDHYYSSPKVSCYSIDNLTRQLRDPETKEFAPDPGAEWKIIEESIK